MFETPGHRTYSNQEFPGVASLARRAMSEEFMRSKDPRLGPGSLWTALPIPACRVLTYGGHVKASLVLYALVLHSNDRSPTVFPSRETIVKFSGVGKNSITPALKTLEHFGFIKILKIKTGRTFRNEYEILRASWHWDEFNEFASRFKNPKGHCTRCGHWIYEDSWKMRAAYDGLATVQIKVHIGCGGRVKNLTKKQMNIVRSQEESAVIPLNHQVRK